MKPRNIILRENHPSSATDTPPSIKQKSSTIRKQKFSNENAPPSDLNVLPYSSPSPSFFGKPSPAGKLRSPLPPRPPPHSSNPLKRKLTLETVDEYGVSESSDSGVKVVVRVRPPTKDEEGGELVVQKTTGDSLSVLGQTFRFDSVLDAESRQIDLFQLVGAPLVENCIAGFNSSVFAYGQTGSGKTYTIWGPSNALFEKNLSSDQQGLTPRVFERLFSRIDEEQNKHSDKQLMYQCRCSFLEIYNEQITDLLHPTQRNLQIREGVKTGVYVENLTEKCVSTINDVTQLLLKGMSNRRTGATSINAESSRSHSVFTCVVESRCKSLADGVSCFKTSRINLVDLAGSERQKLTGAAGERLKEAGNINRSLSQLGNLINILAEVSQTGKQRHIPYRDSKLTFLLQESLGGNAKLVMVCAISPAQSCKSETLSTLRFAQRAKTIKNKAVVNEEMQEDVNVLREVIRQLKDELVRLKSNGNQTDPSGGYSTGWNASRSLSLLKFSLNCPMVLPRVDDDGDEEMEIVEALDQAGILLVGCEENRDKPEIVQFGLQPFPPKGNEDTAMNPSDESLYGDSVGNLVNECLPSVSDLLHRAVVEYQKGPSSEAEQNISPEDAVKAPYSPDGSGDHNAPDLSIGACEVSPLLKSPTPSVSPRVVSPSRKSLRFSSMSTAYQKDPTNSKSVINRTEHLAASLHRGLEILDNYRKSSAVRKSSFRFSYKQVEIKPSLVQKVDVGVQTHLQENESLQLVPVDGPQSAEKSKKLVPKAVEKVLAGAIRREMALEELCARQASEIVHLNRLVQQYKQERECNVVIGEMQEDKIVRLESLLDGVMSKDEFIDDKLALVTNENQILKEKYENHPEILRTKIELQRVQDELESYRNFFDMGERDVLLDEIQALRCQLQDYIDSSPKSARKRNPIPQLTYSCDPSVAPSLCPISESTDDCTEQRLEKERFLWTEAESKWISLTEELRYELEASHSLAEKRKQELDMEKKCSEELKEAMQMAMEGHARMIEQFADLEEKHMQVLARQRRFEDGIEDVKKAAARAGVRGADSKFINTLAAEISALKAEREKERRHYRDEIKGLQAQLRDTVEAVQAAGELLVRLREAEDAVASAQMQAVAAEQETEKVQKQIKKLKHENEITTFHQLLAESNVPKEDASHQCSSTAEDDLTKQGGPEPEPPSSWFSGYDRCNI